MAERKQVKVTIYNQQYSMSTELDPSEVEELAKVVDELIRGIAARAGTSDLGRVAVLACLHMADQLRAAERELTEVSQSTEDRLKDLTKRLSAIGV